MIDEVTFKNNILEYDSLYETAKTYKDNLKNIRSYMKELKEKNISYMKDMGIDACNLSDGQLILKNTIRRTIDVKKTNIGDVILDFLKREEKYDDSDANEFVEKFISFMEENYSKTTESLSLMRTHKK